MSDQRTSMLSPRSGEKRPRTRIDDDSGIEAVYNFGEVLGKGAFGVVWEATHRSNGPKYAIKMVPKDKPGSIAIQMLDNEIEVLSRVNHSHIIKLIEVYETPKKVFMVLEMCEGGELSDLLKEKRVFKEEEVKIIMTSLAEAVVYMHNKDMVHRDLKLENILLSNDLEPGCKYNIKVTDFGLSHMKGLSGSDGLMSTRCGTLYYMAPEVIRNKLEYSKLCDVWSMGVIMYALLCGSMPFKGETASQLEDQIMSGELGFKEVEWITISDGAKELIKGMLNVSTVHRLTARKVLEDPWITGEARKRIDPLMMLMDDSPPTNSAAKTIVDTKSSLTTTEQTKLSPEPLRPPSRSKSMSQSTSTGKVHASSRNRYSGGSPTPRKPVSSSISTGRIQSTSISSKPTVNQRSTTTRKISNSNK